MCVCMYIYLYSSSAQKPLYLEYLEGSYTIDTANAHIIPDTYESHAAPPQRPSDQLRSKEGERSGIQLDAPCEDQKAEGPSQEH